MTIEKEVLKVTGQDARGEDEGSKKYISRLVKAANGLDPEDWDKLSAAAQKWVNANVEAINDQKDLVPLPKPAADEDDKPAKKKSDDDDDKPMAPRKSKGDDDDDDKPKARKTKDEDDDDKPAKKERDPDAKRGAIPRLKELVIKKPGKSKKDLIEILENEGYSISANTAGIAFYDVRNTLKLCKKLGVLDKDYAEKIDDTDNTPEHLKKGREDAKKASKGDDDDDDKPKRSRKDDD